MRRYLSVFVAALVLMLTGVGCGGDTTKDKYKDADKPIPADKPKQANKQGEKG